MQNCGVVGAAGACLQGGGPHLGLCLPRHSLGGALSAGREQDKEESCQNLGRVLVVKKQYLAVLLAILGL